MPDKMSILPQSEEHWHQLRLQDVTSTQSAALFGLSPYSTAFDLWHQKRDQKQPEHRQSGRMKWGLALQDVIGQAVAAERDWKIRRLNCYMRLPDVRMGASFDFEIVSNERGPGILEIKNVDSLIFRNDWLQEGESIEAPAHIEIQFQHQLYIAGRSWGAIAVLVGGNDLRVITRDQYQDVGESIEAKVRDFWASIHAGTPPEPTYPRDAAVIKRIYGFADPGRLCDARTDDELTALCEAYAAARDREKQAKEDREVAHAKILIKIGDAEKAIAGNGYTISAGLIGPTRIEYDREGYRNFKLTKRKEKQTA